MAQIFSYTLNNKERFLAAYDPKRFDMNLRRRMRMATELNGKVTERFQRQTIQSSSGLARNAPLTIAIKHSSKPLVHSGELFQGLTTQVIDDFTAITGIMRTNEKYDIAATITNGVKIKVTDRMRGMFFRLWLADQAGSPDGLEGRALELWNAAGGAIGWKPLSESTSVIVIPPRPWHRLATRAAGYKETIRENWRRAIQMAFHDMVSQ
jgi:hypothetical protein